MYAVTNPATGALIEEYPTISDGDFDAAITTLDSGFRTWRTTPIAERAAAVRRASELFTERTDELAAIITTEMGKRTKEAAGELWLTASIFAWYAENAERLLADEPLDLGRGEAVIRKKPVGVVIGIMPWNFPYYQIARFAAPNLVLGNTILLKHAPNCPRSSAAVEALLRDAGIPADAYVNVYATNEQIARGIADPRVQGISLTGSERAGTSVAQTAGRELKKVVLELGGSDPMLILDSADLAATAKGAARARMANVGQACNSPKRMIVLADLYDEFLEQLVASLEQDYAAGDPADPATTLAPLSSELALTRLLEQLGQAREDGATIRTGGTQIERPGYFLAPTVITDVTPDMRIHTSELFGPIAVVYRAEDEAEAVRLANDTPFGLGASVYSADPERARRVADQIEAGMVYLNSTGGSQADLPFGGVKRSGIGRELGELGIEEFMNKQILKLR